MLRQAQHDSRETHRHCEDEERGRGNLTIGLEIASGNTLAMT
jgi:hypothetical protein